MDRRHFRARVRRALRSQLRAELKEQDLGRCELRRQTREAVKVALRTGRFFGHSTAWWARRPAKAGAL